MQSHLWPSPLMATGLFQVQMMRLYVWEAESGKVISGPLQLMNAVCSVAFSPDGKHIVSGSFDKTACVGCRSKSNCFRTF